MQTSWTNIFSAMKMREGLTWLAGQGRLSRRAMAQAESSKALDIYPGTMSQGRSRLCTAQKHRALATCYAQGYEQHSGHTMFYLKVLEDCEYYPNVLEIFRCLFFALWLYLSHAGISCILDYFFSFKGTAGDPLKHRGSLSRIQDVRPGQTPSSHMHTHTTGLWRWEN